jgi:ribosomal protein S7
MIQVALEKLRELGYKPRKKPETGKESEIESILQQVEESETRKQILNLLVEALSEADPREILVYGMYVKKYLSPMVPATRREKIEKTLEWLSDAIRLIEKSGRK